MKIKEKLDKKLLEKVSSKEEIQKRIIKQAEPYRMSLKYLREEINPRGKEDFMFYCEDELQRAIGKAIQQYEKEILEMINADKIYPKDVFPEINPDRLKKVNGLLKANFGFPLDRLSAHIARLLLRNLEKEIRGGNEKF